MYDETVKRLKNCATQAAPCLTCDMTDDGSCIETLMKQAADAIEELVPFKKQVEKGMGLLGKADELLNAVKPRWIPVTERLPSNSTKVLVFEFGRVEQAYTTTYTADGSLCWVVINGGSYHRVYDADCPIKWWMPLPQPPKEEH